MLVAQIPGSAEKGAFLQLHLTEDTLALAVAETAGELAGGLLDDAKHDHHIARLFRHRPQGDLDITEQLGGVEPFDIPLKLIAVERIAGLDRNLSGDHPLLGLAADGIAVLIGVITLFGEEFDLNTSDTPLEQLQRDHTFRADPLRTGHPCQGIALIGH